MNSKPIQMARSANTHLPDDAIMRAVCNGSHEAFAKLVSLHTDRFLALAFRTVQHRGDAEDIVQTAFIKLWQNPRAWRADDSRFTTWFYRVILNACYDHLRKHPKSRQWQDRAAEAVQATVESEQNLLEERQQQAWRKSCLESALAKLPAAQRDSLNLVVYLELPQKQAAQIMGISLKALESLLFRAKRSLAKDLEEQLGTPEMPGIADEFPRRAMQYATPVATTVRKSYD